MCRWVSGLMAVGVLATASGALAAEPPNPTGEAQLAKLLEGRVAGKPDHKMGNEQMIDHIVELVEARAAQIEAEKAAAGLQAAE